MAVASLVEVKIRQVAETLTAYMHGVGRFGNRVRYTRDKQVRILEHCASVLQTRLSTGVSAPDRVLDRDTWESQSDADRQSAAGTPVKVCQPTLLGCGQVGEGAGFWHQIPWVRVLPPQLFEEETCLFITTKH